MTNLNPSSSNHSCAHHQLQQTHTNIQGLFQELAPLLMNATGDGLTFNPWSWNTLAHLLIIEAPIGVGYSYCGAQLANRGI